VKHVIEGKVEGRMEMTGRQDDVNGYWMAFKEAREYCKLKEEALDRTVWKTGFGRGCGPVVRQAAG